MYAIPAQDAFGGSNRGLQDVILGIQIIAVVAAAVLAPFVGMVLQLAGFHAKLGTLIYILALF